MKIVLQVNGGIGKSVSATAVCRAIKKQHPAAELIVITGYPEVFLQNPHVSRVLTFNNLNYFYQDHIEGRETRLMLQDPYNEDAFIHQRGHLTEVWCAMNGIAWDGPKPELYITGKEKTTFAPLFASDKPVMVIQTNGGVPNQADKYSWPRDLPLATAQRVVNAFAGEYNVVHLRRQDQLPLQNTWPVTADFRQVAVLLMLSSKRLFIDSFAQHAAAALDMPSVVCWVANAPSQFGYDTHHNIMARAPTLRPELRNAVFNKYNIMGQPVDFPYNSEDELFDADNIIAAVRQFDGNPVLQARQHDVAAEAKAGGGSAAAKAVADDKKKVPAVTA